MIKSPATIVLLFVMPLVFSFVFGSLQAGDEEKPVVNIVESENELGIEIAKLFRQNNKYEWTTVSLEKAKKNVSDQKVIAAIVIPDDMEKRLQEKSPLFETIVYQQTEQYLALSPYLEGTAILVHQLFNDSMQLQEGEFQNVLRSMASNKLIELTNQSVGDLEEEPVNLTPIGFTIMFMMFAITGAASEIHTERTQKTWQRLNTSPINKFQLLCGYLLSFFVIGWIQLGTLMVVMKIIFGVNWGNLFYLIPFASLTILMIVGFSIMLAGLTKTKHQAEVFNAILIVSTCMLGGVYWPLDIVPPIMQQISKFVPQSWMMSGFEEIMSGSINQSILNMNIIVLGGFTSLFLVIGLFKLNRIQ